MYMKVSNGLTGRLTDINSNVETLGLVTSFDKGSTDIEAILDLHGGWRSIRQLRRGHLFGGAERGAGSGVVLWVSPLT